MLKLSPGLLMLASLVLLVIGLALREYLEYFVFVALGLFAFGYVWSMSVRSRRRRGVTSGVRAPASRGRQDRGGRDVYWRGERVDTMEPRTPPANVVSFKPSFWARARRLFRK